MFALLSRGINNFMASVSGAVQQAKSPGDSPLSGSVDSRSVNSNRSANKAMPIEYQVHRLSKDNISEIVQFLVEHFAPNEPILAGLHINNEIELQKLFEDLVDDAVKCKSSVLIRGDGGAIDGVCLACDASVFDQQIDRLCRYPISNRNVLNAVDFLKYVFNKLDAQFHFENNKVSKPVFVAVVAVRSDKWGRGMGRQLVNSCIEHAKEDRCDGAITMLSNKRAISLMENIFSTTLSSVRYDSFRGEQREPPIVMPPDENQRSLLVNLAKF